MSFPHWAGTVASHSLTKPSNQTPSAPPEEERPLAFNPACKAHNVAQQTLLSGDLKDFAATEKASAPTYPLTSTSARSCDKLTKWFLGFLLFIFALVLILC